MSAWGAKRDVKWLSKKAGSGTLKNVTSIDSPYERPIATAIHINTGRLSPELAAEGIGEQVLGIWSADL